MEKGTKLLEGSIWKGIVAFAIPLFLGNLFQQLYNTVDSLIVGNFLGSDALAAVSSSGSLIFLLVGFFNGIAVGAGVVISKYFGARDYENLKKAVHTDVAFGLVSGLLLTVIGMFLAPQILVLMGTPESVLPNSILYFRIYFAGSLAFVMYNIVMGILQAVGDSRHPLYYLIFSSIVNIVLDLLFLVSSAAIISTSFNILNTLTGGECAALFYPAGAHERYLSGKNTGDPVSSGAASADYQLWSALRSAELDYFDCQHRGAVQH